MRAQWRIELGMFLILAGAGNAWSSSFTIFSDRAAFESALPGFTKYTFEVEDGFADAGWGPVPTSSFGPVRVRTNRVGAGIPSIDLMPDYNQHGQFVRRADVLEFVDPPDAVGFVWVSDMPSVVVRMSLGGAREIEWFQSNSNRFFGVISRDPILSIRIADPPGIFLPRYGIDDLTISPMVPEPGSIGIMTCAIIALHKVTRRKQTQRNGQ